MGLVWQLRRRVGSKSLQATQTMLQRLINMAIRTGFVTSFFAILVLAFFLQNVEGGVAVGLNECLGRIYALTMLHNLNSRRAIREAGTASGSGGSGNPETRNRGAINLTRIRVDHHTITASDVEGVPPKRNDYDPEDATQSDDGSVRNKPADAL
ncbi:hypothetical protein PUNSTDRAFT_134730 [Punctularia strigosozonata HHB-11173 SS5]|uniref:uncharacterized protein n=1 Tax=Punctularia strigosozonata (strain HHB-11173) TaxID=741275 RepID=UPI0004416A33|nr:uncharacterized protein PUNSTDRAFT_134730 [Punctularia strigosozonata HHB-11173 SS5]EIN08342.1 hypothetical protein PUNSTDRAFT_134730 [Punctularia strigosozonata HHB-11173 SS5]